MLLFKKSGGGRIWFGPPAVALGKDPGDLFRNLGRNLLLFYGKIQLEIKEL